ncbi:MAG: hypothetical protein ACI35P_13055 [Bacillus sp. (in: firmicutes)]
MKHNKIFYVFLGVFLFLIAGCSNGSESEGSKILVQERVGEENEYKHFKEITDNQTVKRAKDILESISWENAEVNMAIYPQYKFHFEGDTEQPERIYDIYINPNTGTAELVNIYEGEYAKLSKSELVKLFETTIGIKLSDVD